MFLNPAFSLVFCVMAVTYIMLVGSISWVAWNQEDDGVRGLALYLTATPLSYILLFFYGRLPDLVVMGGFYVITSAGLIFLQYATVKFFRAKMYWTPYLVMLAVLAGLMMAFRGDMITQTKISDMFYIAQYLIICVTFFRRKPAFPSCGTNMVLAGMVLAILITLWWLIQCIENPDQLYHSSGSSTIEIELYFSSYIITLLITNGFLLMTKERVQAQLRDNLREDDLTGLPSGSRIELDARRNLDQLRQLALPVTLLLFDIDFFKDVNQQYDYNTGNQIIRELGDMLQREVTVSHEIYRIKGGKFAVIIPALNIYQIMDLAEKILQSVSDNIFGQDCHITVSCGISVATSADIWTSWLFRAQHALQKAKAYGRNRIQVDEIDFSDENLPNGITRIGKLHWHPKYNSGHPDIDQQHRQLFENTNTLLQIWIRNGTKETICQYVSELLDQVKNHYAFEQNLLKRHEVKFSVRVKAHLTRHSDLLERANDLFSRYKRSEMPRDALFNFLIFECVSVHIRDADGDIAELLQSTEI